MMTKKSPCAVASAILLCWLISIPSHSWAAPEGAPERAGEVSRVIPAVNIARGGKTIPAAAKTVVNWQDLVNTQVNHETDPGAQSDPPGRIWASGEPWESWPER